ncbi:uncharacterized protein LOC111829739 [Capsella rubella]|uniref:uncharacterized protein LOC111829739 n=1 Tax=Capsella rubella TaxID=81985 RepID=UPI000CD50526|nr:uncharacterized protein LOC111829739 [Capsella rubella]
MGKFSSKAAFIILLAFAVIMISVTVEIVEAKRLLLEETSQHLLDLKAPHSIKPLMARFCTPDCTPLCFATACHCVCPPKKI